MLTAHFGQLKRGFSADCCMNVKVFFSVPAGNGLKTLPTFRPECTGLLQGNDDVGKVFSPFLARTEEPFTVHFGQLSNFFVYHLLFKGAHFHFTYIDMHLYVTVKFRTPYHLIYHFQPNGMISLSTPPSLIQ